MESSSAQCELVKLRFGSCHTWVVVGSRPFRECSRSTWMGACYRCQGNQAGNGPCIRAENREETVFEPHAETLPNLSSNPCGGNIGEKFPLEFYPSNNVLSITRSATTHKQGYGACDKRVNTFGKKTLVFGPMISGGHGGTRHHALTRSGMPQRHRDIEKGEYRRQNSEGRTKQ